MFCPHSCGHFYYKKEIPSRNGVRDDNGGGNDME